MPEIIGEDHLLYQQEEQFRKLLSELIEVNSIPIYTARAVMISMSIECGLEVFSADRVKKDLCAMVDLYTQNQK